MAIKMRLRKVKDACCDACGCKPENMLDLFDVMIGDTVLKVCDDCMEVLLNKSLKAKCYTQGRVKQQSEMRIINARARNRRYREGRW